jgi:hypothetical protein
VLCDVISVLAELMVRLESMVAPARAIDSCSVPAQSMVATEEVADTREENYPPHVCWLQACRRAIRWHPRVQLSVENRAPYIVNWLLEGVG